MESTNFSFDSHEIVVEQKKKHDMKDFNRIVIEVRGIKIKGRLFNIQ